MSNTEPIYEYDTNGNLIHYKDSNGFEYWREFDTNGKCIHFKTNGGFEYWYDSDGNVIDKPTEKKDNTTMSNTNEPIYEYDTNGNLIHYKDSNGFEYWREFDTNGKCIHYKDSTGFECWREYDSNGNEIHYKNNGGFEQWYDSDGNEIDKPTEKKDNTAMRNDKKYIITNGIDFLKRSFSVDNFGGWTYHPDIHRATKFTLAEAMSIMSKREKEGIHSDYTVHEFICYVGEKYVDKRKTLIEDLERAASSVGYFIQSADIRYTQNIINAAIEYLKEQKD